MRAECAFRDRGARTRSSRRHLTKIRNARVVRFVEIIRTIEIGVIRANSSFCSFLFFSIACVQPRSRRAKLREARFFCIFPRKLIVLFFHIFEFFIILLEFSPEANLDSIQFIEGTISRINERTVLLLPMNFQKSNRISRFFHQVRRIRKSME